LSIASTGGWRERGCPIAFGGHLMARGLRICELIHPGRVGYDEAIEKMELRARARRQQLVEDALILLEHDPVVTLGRAARESNLLVAREQLEREGVAVRESGRGGDVTYHGPGQLVGYPVIELEPPRRDAHRYLRDLERVLILALSDVGIRAQRRPGLTGVWLGAAKIASIGVRLSRWVTSHGFALNVGGDLGGFRAIVPCGIAGCEMTSLERLLGRPVGLDEISGPVARRFGEVFGRRMVAAGARAEVDPRSFERGSAP